ncbi:MAG: non-heme iron oxygenase ferredoxin subunit [Acidimicrobiales bacterium]|nr:non-heme iron oxygenase ferredoxin subunit [Acidimicrobiales bacterium]
MTKVERLGRLDDLAPGTARQVLVGEHRIALVRIDDDVYAIGDRCSHQDISLADGDVLCDDRQLECWKHGSAFSLLDGEPTSLPATRPVPVYEVRVVEGEIEVVLDA